MAIRRMLLLGLLPALAAGSALAACGGGGDSDDNGPFGGFGGPTATPDDDGDAPEQDSSDGGPELTANPSEAWAEVEGERLIYNASGSVHYVCDIGNELVQVNFQTAEGRDFLIQLTRQGNDWVGSLLFKPGGPGNVQFSAILPADADELGVRGGTLSFRGIVGRLENFDISTERDVDADIAVNCESAGGDPTAAINGRTYVIPISGAQSYECEISDGSLKVRINRLSRDDLQLEIDASQDGTWFGHVVVYTPDGNFTSIVPEDGEGLEVEGTGLTYTGTFSQDDDAYEGTVSVACPG